MPPPLDHRNNRWGYERIRIDMPLVVNNYLYLYLIIICLNNVSGIWKKSVWNNRVLNRYISVNYSISTRQYINRYNYYNTNFDGLPPAPLYNLRILCKKHPSIFFFFFSKTQSTPNIYNITLLTAMYLFFSSSYYF